MAELRLRLSKPDQASSAALEGQQYCTKLFAMEKELDKLTPEERYAQRLKQEKPVLDALLAWSQTKSAPSKSTFGKALYYLQEQWPYLICYLEDGWLELSNNRAEQYQAVCDGPQELAFRKYIGRRTRQRYPLQYH